MPELRRSHVHCGTTRCEDVRRLAAPVDVHDRSHDGTDERGGVEGDGSLEPVRGLEGDDVSRTHAIGHQTRKQPVAPGRGHPRRCRSMGASGSGSRTEDPSGPGARRTSVGPRCGRATTPRRQTGGGPRKRSRAGPTWSLPSERRHPPRWTSPTPANGAHDIQDSGSCEVGTNVSFLTQKWKTMHGSWSLLRRSAGFCRPTGPLGWHRSLSLSVDGRPAELPQLVSDLIGRLIQARAVVVMEDGHRELGDKPGGVLGILRLEVSRCHCSPHLIDQEIRIGLRRLGDLGRVERLQPEMLRGDETGAARWTRRAL